MRGLLVLLLLLAAVAWLLSPLVLALLLVTAAALYRHLTRHFAFWPSRGVHGPAPALPFGHAHRPADGKWSVTELDAWLYGHRTAGRRLCGYLELGRPALTVGDLDLVRAVTVSDFEHFTDRRPLAISRCFEGMLSLLTGAEWKRTRAVMSPTFSASKLRAMHQLCLDNAARLAGHLRREMKSRRRVEMKDAFGRFTMDNIAACAFGVNCDSFEDKHTEFSRHAGALLAPIKGLLSLRLVLHLTMPHWVGDLIPDTRQASGDFFKRVVNRTIEQREGGGGGGVARRDFLHLLLETRHTDGRRVLSDDSIVAQSVAFFAAGYDTTSTLLTFAAYSLATNPNVQRRAQAEIDEVLERHGGQLTYEGVGEMSYLDRVISETLRLYPPITRMERQCTKEYTLPGTEVHIPRGTLVQIPVLSIHRDPEHYPDPLRFDPDRFLPEQRERRHPCAYLAFGSGPRNCIAMRFALFEAKVALVSVLRESTLLPSPDTPPPPLPFDKTAMLLAPDGDTFLLLEARA